MVMWLEYSTSCTCYDISYYYILYHVHLQPLFATKVLPNYMRERVDDMSSMASKESPTGFSEEFDHLHSYQCKVLHSRKEGTKPANQSKNRYPNIIPCKLMK